MTFLILVIIALCVGAALAGSQETGEALALLRAREDSRALAAFQQILEREPDNSSALWGKAEILRRGRKFKESEAMLNEVLKKDPDYPSALISLAYIRYNDNKLKEALSLIKQALKSRALSKENRALAFMMLGTINSKRSQGGIINKIQYGTQIKSYFLKAAKTAPELAEVHLGLGTFYLKAPVIAGGNLDKAIEELKTCLKLAPEFATATARLAQAYKKKGNLDKYDFYIKRAKELDPENEVLKEIGC